ncbi:SRPBCC family protein [Dactylosporangium sp. NPDC000555]|uniref:SRPBCC family protein n=1 Tax=Dactylosporangium sp. NPDC000555 TaxID=3154260 RepID=UPI00331B1EA5
MASKANGRAGTGLGHKVTELLLDELRNLAAAAGERALAAVGDKVGSVTERLTEYAQGSGNTGLVAAVTGAKKMAEGRSPSSAMVSGGLAGIKEKIKGLFGRGKGKGADKNFNRKVTNIVETIDVGVPLRVAYNQWTQFQDLPSFMKKLENVKKESDEKSNWKAQVWWSHRDWEATIVQQIPDNCIVWRSKAAKGRVDGTVTFHDLAPNLTRILLVLEYHPQGLFEQTGNLWRAQGRRARLEFKHFRRHVMTRTILNPDEVEGWRGEIRDGEVVKDHETALQEEQEQQEKEKQRAERGEEEPYEEAPEEAGEKPGEEKPEEEPDEEPEQEPPSRRRQTAARTSPVSSNETP